MADTPAAATDAAPARRSLLKRALLPIAIVLIAGASAAGGYLANRLVAPPQDEFAGLIAPAPAAAPPEHHEAADETEDCVPAAASDAHGGESEGGHEPAKDAHAEGKPPCGPKRKKVEVQPEFATTYYEFPGNFTANLRASRHYIQVQIAVSTQYDEQVITNVKAHEPAIRGAVIATLSDCMAEDIVGVEAKAEVAGRLRDAINAVLVQKTRFGGIEDVHFTSFVTQ